MLGIVCVVRNPVFIESAGAAVGRTSQFQWLQPATEMVLEVGSRHLYGPQEVITTAVKSMAGGVGRRPSPAKA